MTEDVSGVQRLARPAHRHSLDPTPAQPGSHPTGPPSHRCVPRTDQTSSSGRARDEDVPDNRDPAVPRSRTSEITPHLPGSRGAAGRPRQAHRIGPSVAQDVSPTLQVVSPLIQDVPSTGQQPAPHDPVTRLVKECDPPSRPERLDLHEHQVPDLQGKDSSCAVTRSNVSSGPTAIASPRDLDRAPHGPVPSDRALRPAPRTDLDRRTRNPAFSMRVTRPVQPCNPSCPLAGDALYQRRSALCARRDALSSGEASRRSEVCGHK